MPRIVIRFVDVSAAPRPNRHWTDEEFASRLCGDLTALEQAEARWLTRVRGSVLLLVMGLLIVCGLSW